MCDHQYARWRPVIVGGDDGMATIQGHALFCANAACGQIVSTDEGMAPQPTYIALEKDPEGRYVNHVGPTEWMF